MNPIRSQGKGAEMKSNWNSPGPRILLAEDHASTRLGVKQILQDAFPGIVIGEAGNAREALALLESCRWELLILDICLPDRHGLDVLRETRISHPALPVLVYSAYPEEQFQTPSLRLGASGYLPKGCEPEELCAAVRALLSGGNYTRALRATRSCPSPAPARSGLPHERLSARELQVLRFTAAGRTGKAIADDLHLSQKTVSTYRMRILRKLKINNTAELVQYAVRNGLL